MTNIEKLAEIISKVFGSVYFFTYQEITRVSICEAIPKSKLTFDVYGSNGKIQRCTMSAFDDDSAELIPAVAQLIDLYSQAEKLEEEINRWSVASFTEKRPTTQVNDAFAAAVRLAHSNRRNAKVIEITSARNDLTLAIEVFTGKCIKESA